MNRDSEKSIFLRALELPSESERDSFLLSACGEGTPLRASVDALLAAHHRGDHPLDQPVARAMLELNEIEINDTQAPKSDSCHDDHIGLTIGPYRLLEQIGEGGFGLVFVARQEWPVKRQVALKIVKPGTGSKEVLARFAAEQQAVAIMDHPNIAQIFDAGMTDDGRPYFVMELVRGVPFIDFCDQRRLNLRQRLELMIDICLAVHHAHQKGVIHRDLKPSNVLVMLRDDRPIAKVIDFGVAKAIGKNLTDQTIYTRFYALIGTPLYMSPEQAQMSDGDIDTRSDIYSLGVMLYELLTGTTPVERDRLNSAGYDEMRRIIREEEPPRPSMRLTTLGERLSTVSAQRRSVPERLDSTLRGDLDWIVMKSLEKDRSRRYESAAALAGDLRRYLNGAPVEARPPSRTYLAQKFARRNRVAIITAALVTVAMMVGTAVSLWQASVAITERNEKEEALQVAVEAKNQADQARHEVEAFAERMAATNMLVASAETHANAGRWYSADQDYTRATELQPSYFLPWVQRGQMYVRLKLWDRAADDYARAVALGGASDAPQWWGVPALLLLTGAMDEYRSLRDQQLRQIDSSAPAWNAVRTAVISSREPADHSFIELAEWTRKWSETRSGPPRFPHGRQRRAGTEPSSRAQRRDSKSRPPDAVPFSEPGVSGRPSIRPRPPIPDQADRGYRPPPPFPSENQGPPRDRRAGTHNGHHPLGATAYVTGLAELRAKNFSTAIDHFQMASNDRGWGGRRLVLPALVIALQRDGRTEQAEKALQAAEAEMNRLVGAIASDPKTPLPMPWFDFVEARVLLREASAAVKFTPTDPDPRWELIREQSIELLNNP